MLLYPIGCLLYDESDRECSARNANLLLCVVIFSLTDAIHFFSFTLIACYVISPFLPPSLYPSPSHSPSSLCLCLPPSLYLSPFSLSLSIPSPPSLSTSPSLSVSLFLPVSLSRSPDSLVLPEVLCLDLCLLLLLFITSFPDNDAF